MSNNIPKKKSMNRASSEKEAGSQNNQKKNLSRKSTEPKVGRNREEEVFENNHVKENIFEKRTKGLYSCKLCPNSEFSFKYIRKHLLSSNHKNRVFDNQDFEKLMNVLMKEKEESTTDEKKDTEDYLAFINLCASLSLSIRQISKLAKGLKNLYFPSKLRFLQKNDFDESNISIAINSFGDYCLEKLKEDLSNSKYSLAIDNSTISKTSICAIKGNI